MARYQQQRKSKGSQAAIQDWANNRKERLNSEIQTKAGLSEGIVWLSPLEADQYAEYGDEDFIDALELTGSLIVPLAEFWPPRGPQWDGLALAGRTRILVEAKSNLPELVSSPSQASDNSIQMIQSSLNRTKQYLGVQEEKKWTADYYQYTNRMAHLFFLRILNKVDARLVFLYFLNDETVSGPKSTSEWETAIAEMYKELGLQMENPLSPFIHNVYIDLKPT